MKIYCSGIGGIGLSAYAALQKQAGHSVSGSDRSDSALLDDLRKQGITVFLEQDGSHVTEEIDLFVYSEAIPIDSPEREKAEKLGIPQQTYFEGLGEISKDCRVVAICGTHGKSSTVAMAVRVLVDAGKDPTVVVGTKLTELDGRNWRKGKSNLFLLEACEYRRNFLFLSPDIVVMTSADGDHFDSFDDLEDYQQAYAEFLQKLPQGGPVITHGADPDCQQVVSTSDRPVIDADTLPLPEVSTPGRHMQENAQLALALAEHLGIDQRKALASLKGYEGSWRRMEEKGTFGDDVLVMDDYGHHPREIRAVLQAAKEAYPDRRLVCVFQPHTHHRTLTLYDDFLSSFTDADYLVITDVYEARKDIEQDTVDMPKFLKDIEEKSGVPVRDGASLQETEKLILEEIAQPHDLILCMGAGDITDVATQLVRKA